MWTFLSTVHGVKGERERKLVMGIMVKSIPIDQIDHILFWQGRKVCRAQGSHSQFGPWGSSWDTRGGCQSFL